MGISQQPNPSLIHVAYTTHPWPEIEDWCNVNIGKWNKDWYKLGEDPAAQIFNPNYRSTYYFRTEEQALMFTLRWV